MLWQDSNIQFLWTDGFSCGQKGEAIPGAGNEEKEITQSRGKAESSSQNVKFENVLFVMQVVQSFKSSCLWIWFSPGKNVEQQRVKERTWGGGVGGGSDIENLASISVPLGLAKKLKQ
jgi:hypothetical protein